MTEVMVSSLLTNIVIPLAGLVVTCLAGKLVNTLNKKYNLEITQQEIKNAVNFAERIAENAVKAGTPKLTSGQKLEQAVAYVEKVIPQKDKEVLKKKIEAAVQQYRANGNSTK